LVLMGYLYGIRSFLQLTWFSPMALHSALTFLVALAGVLLFRPTMGVMSLLGSRTLGGLLLRWLLPAALLVPAALGWLHIRGLRTGMFDAEFGAAAVTVLTIAFFSVLVWRIGRLQ